MVRAKAVRDEGDDGANDGDEDDDYDDGDKEEDQLVTGADQVIASQSNDSE